MAWLRSDARRASPTPPGPTGLAFLGHALSLRHDALGFLTETAQRYGDIARVKIGRQTAFLINSPTLIEEVLVAQGRNFIKTAGAQPARARGRPVKNDLMTWIRNFPSDGEAWRSDRDLAPPSHQGRKLITPALQARRVEGYASQMVSLAERCVANWRDGEVRDVHSDLTRLSLEITAKTLFGVDVVNPAELADAFGVILARIFGQLRNPLQIPPRIPTPANRRLARAVKVVEKFIAVIVAREDADRDGSDLLSTMLGQKVEEVDDEWKYGAMTVFVAGFETTALALTWALYLLAENPKVAADLSIEVETVIGSGLPSAEHVDQLRLCDRVVKETLRLYPPVWLLAPRAAIKDFSLGGYVIPAQSTILICPWVTQRDPRFFERPLAFDPERWLDDRDPPAPKFAYIPFSGGPRHCVGRHHAMLECILVLATMIRSFNFQRALGQQVRPAPLVTLQPYRGLIMKLERR